MPSKDSDQVSPTKHHPKTGSDLKLHACNICNQKFKNKSKLEEHSSTNHLTERKQVDFAECGKKCRSKTSLKVRLVKTHLRSYTKNDKRYKYECKACQKRFVKKYSLACHIKTIHRKEKPFGCAHCAMRFSFKYKLARHLPVHDERRFLCQKCNGGFRTKALLRSHNTSEHPTKIEHSKDSDQVLPSTDRPKTGSDLKPFVCDICSLRFKYKSKLQEHSRTHYPTKEKQFECAECGNTFISKTTLKVHLVKMHSNTSTENVESDIQECKTCEKKFANKYSLAYHIKTIHRKEKPFKCAHCAMRFSLKYRLNKHLLLTHDERRFFCQKCDGGFRTRALLRSHETLEHPTRIEEQSPTKNINVLEMTEEDKIKEQGPTRKINVLEMTEEDKMKCLEELKKEHREIEICKLCDKSKPTQAHLMVHLEIKPFQCKSCDRLFRHKSSLKSHSCTGEEDRQQDSSHKCKVCKQILSSASSLRAHMLRHGSPKYECQICGKRFFVKWDMVCHVRVHESEKSFRCDQCSKSFKTKKALGRHSVVHADEYRFKCEKCKEVFKHKNGLTWHQQKHAANPQTFSCEICKESFGTKQVLIYHLQTHDKEMNFSCKLCDKSFSSKRLLQAHSKRHTNQQP